MLTSSCKGCTACVYACHVGAISMKQNGKGFIVASIDKDKCIECRNCVKICSQRIILESERIHKAYIAKNKDSSQRKSSSSGGVFYPLAETIVEKGGIVFGAAFNMNNEVVHLCIDNLDGLKKLQKTKYVQSELANTLELIRQYLDCGRLVLFSGTPCQVEAVYKHVGVHYPNLITLDIICHGVPSRGFWADYLTYLQRGKKTSIRKIDFRDKQTGWHRFSFSYFAGNKKKTRLFIDDPFCYFFDKHFILNEPCFSCTYAGSDHLADITLGDFWGVENFKEIVDDNGGLSLMQVNSMKGASLLSKINCLDLDEVDYNTALQYNHSKPAMKPEQYNSFWDDYGNCGLEYCVQKYFYGSKKARTLKKVKIAVKSALIKTNLIRLFIKVVCIMKLDT